MVVMENLQKSEKENKGAKGYAPYILLFLGLLLLYNIIQVSSIRSSVNDAILAEKEAAIPLDVTLTLITASTCDDCVEIDDFVAAIKAENVNVLEEKELDVTSSDAQALIAQYELTTAPAVILQGAFDEKADVAAQLEKTMIPLSETVMVFQATTPPYVDLVSGVVKGLVTVTLLTTPECDECREIKSMVTALETILTVQEFNEIAYGSPEADALVAQYNPSFVPTLFLSEDASVYEGFADLWLNYGTIEEDGTFVLRNSIPPYLNTTTEKVEGIVDITYLTDESCTTCYDVSIHKTILAGFGVIFGDEQTVDINTEKGKALLQKYTITKVPTIILSPEVASYTTVTKIWKAVGVVADDGSYIFTNMAQLQGANYTDLITSSRVGGLE